MTDRKSIEPQDPKTAAQPTAEQKRETERQAKGFRPKWRKVFRRASAYKWGR